jgi:hypothetical protein
MMPTETPSKTEAKPKVSVASIIDLMDCSFKPFRSTDGTPYAVYSHPGDHDRNIGPTVSPVESRAFKAAIRVYGYRATGRPLKSEEVAEIASTYEARALDPSSEVREVNLRVAKQDGVYWIDMGDASGRAIKVTPGRWSIEAKHPIMFVRAPGTLPFPEPVPDGKGSLAPLWEAINIPKDKRAIVQAWMLECFRPETMYPLFMLCGQEGSAKSSTQTLLRALTDPNSVPLTKPANEDGLRAMSSAYHMVTFENVSHLTPEMQDTLCSISTGSGGSVRRALYANTDVNVVSVKRPVMLNSLTNVITRNDLLSRALVITAEPLKVSRTQEVLAARNEAMLPVAFGGLLDCFAATLAKLPTATITETSGRLPGYRQLGEAMTQALGKEIGYFEQKLDGFVAEQRALAVEDDPVGSVVLNYLERKPTGFTGQMGALLSTLQVETDNRSFPQTPRGLLNALLRLSAGLRGMGIVFEKGRLMHGRTHYTLRKEDREPAKALPNSVVSILTHAAKSAAKPRRAKELLVIEANSADI